MNIWIILGTFAIGFVAGALVATNFAKWTDGSNLMPMSKEERDREVQENADAQAEHERFLQDKQDGKLVEGEQDPLPETSEWVIGTIDVRLVDHAPSIAAAESPAGKPFLVLTAPDGTRIAISTNIAEMIGDCRAGLRNRHGRRRKLPPRKPRDGQLRSRHR